MKLKKLNINSYLHLKDLEFDFTYPENHEKAGQPLEKICFIGQSATGKTNLLNFIKTIIERILNIEIDSNNDISFFDIFYIDADFEIEINKNLFTIKDKTLYIDSEKKHISVLPKEYDLFPEKHPIYNIKSDIVSEQNIKSLDIRYEDIIEPQEFVQLNKNIDFNFNTEKKLWKSLLQDVINFRKKQLQLTSEMLINKDNIEEFINEISNLNSQNPLIEYSNIFNPILKKLNLYIDVKNSNNLISFRNISDDNLIEIEDISTGTRQLLLTFLILKKLVTKNSIILVDEPERSLYPDIQMEIVDFYTNISENSQFIIATHSPFIAASFEPEERFILYFDENGNVKVRRGSSPIGDDPNDILANDFGINYINKYGQKAFEEYKNLKQKIYFEKNEKKKEEISKKLEELGEKYNF
jgi:ABC-type lipoprotein export system ATPase subunit